MVICKISFLINCSRRDAYLLSPVGVYAHDPVFERSVRSTFLTKIFLYFLSFFGGLIMQRESVYDRMTNAERDVANVLKEFGIQWAYEQPACVIG